MNLIETQLQMTCSRLSNREHVEIEDAWIEKAANDFKAALRKQLKPEKRDFSIRASNLGRPLCQLQREARGMEGAPLPYHFITKMMMGDVIEIYIELLLKASGINITGGKDKVTYKVGDIEINGETDIDIDGRVYDAKSSSDFAFANKWSGGLNRIRDNDDFGYLSQLVIYSEGQQKPAGGWIVWNKNTGEIQVVEADLTEEDKQGVIEQVKEVTAALHGPLVKCFEPEEETYYRKPTGNLKVPMTCTYCPFMKDCWPDAVYAPQSQSRSDNPKWNWYTQYNAN